MVALRPEGLSTQGPTIADRFRELAGDTAVYGVTNAISKSVALFLVPIYTRVFTPAEFGILDILLVTGSFLNLFMHLELHSALARYFYDYSEAERPAVVSTVLWSVAGLGSIIAMGGMALAHPIGAWTGDPAVPGHVRIVVGTALASSLFSIATLQLRLDRRSLQYSAVHLLNILLAAGLSVLLVVGMRWGIRGALWGQFWGSVVGATLALWTVRRYLKPAFRPTLLRRSLRFSLPTIPGMAAGWLRRYGDRWIILAFLSVNSLGIYALGAKIAMIPRMVVQSLTLSWLPFSMSLLGDDNQKEIYARSLRYYVLFMGPLGVLVAGASPELIAIFGTAAYSGAETVVGWLAGAAIVSGSGMILWVGAMVEERTAVSSIASWAGAFGVMAAMGALVPPFGIDGAAMAVFVGSLVQIGVMFHMSQRLYPIQFAVRPALGFVAAYIVFMGLLYAGEALQEGAYRLTRFGGVLAFLTASYFVLLTAPERVRLQQGVAQRFHDWRSGRSHPPEETKK